MAADKRMIEADSRQQLRCYSEWAARTFSPDDLFVTVKLKGIRAPEKFVIRKVQTIYQNAFMRRPHSLLCLPVINWDADFPHLHMLMQNYFYRSSKHYCFASLVKGTFLNSCKSPNSVDVRPINENIKATSVYTLLKQGTHVNVVVDAMNIFPKATQSFTFTH